MNHFYHEFLIYLIDDSLDFCRQSALYCVRTANYGERLQGIGRGLRQAAERPKRCALDRVYLGSVEHRNPITLLLYCANSVF